MQPRLRLFGTSFLNSVPEDKFSCSSVLILLIYAHLLGQSETFQLPVFTIAQKLVPQPDACLQQMSSANVSMFIRELLSNLIG
jgi:hypothetical protein